MLKEHYTATKVNMKYHKFANFRALRAQNLRLQVGARSAPKIFDFFQLLLSQSETWIDASEFGHPPLENPVSATALNHSNMATPAEAAI